MHQMSVWHLKKLIFHLYLMFKLGLIASAILDVILQKQKNYDITCNVMLFLNSKMFMASDIYDAFFKF